MLQDDLASWLWLLLPGGTALVGFAFLGAAMAWSRRSEDREAISSLPGQVRKRPRDWGPLDRFSRRVGVAARWVPPAPADKMDGGLPNDGLPSIEPIAAAGAGGSNAASSRAYAP